MGVSDIVWIGPSKDNHRKLKYFPKKAILLRRKTLNNKVVGLCIVLVRLQFGVLQSPAPRFGARDAFLGLHSTGGYSMGGYSVQSPDLERTNEGYFGPFIVNAV